MADAERIFQVDLIRFRPLFCTDREKRLSARSFVVEQILNLFFWPPQAFKVVPYLSFHWSPSVRENSPRSPTSCAFAELRNPDDVRSKSSDRHFIEKNDLYRERYKSDGTSIRGAWPMLTDRENWFDLGTFLTLSFDILSISNWNFAQYFRTLVWMFSPLFSNRSSRKLCQNLDTTALSVQKQTPQKTPPKPLSCRLVSKKTKRNG